RVDLHVGESRVGVEIERLLPRLPAVGRLVHAPVFVRAPEVAHRGDVADVRVRRVDRHPADLPRLGEAEVRPRLPGVGALVDPLAPRHAVPRVALAGADVHHVRLPLADGDGADAERVLRVEDRGPGAAGIGRLPDPAVGRGDVPDLR